MSLRPLSLDCLVLLLPVRIASPQVVTQGSIVAIVTDPQGSRLPGAAVAARTPDSVTAREAVTHNVTDGFNGTFGANLDTEIISIF